jgi:hypothetical protein
VNLCSFDFTSSQNEVFFCRIDELFVVEDKTIRVKHLGEESKVLVWRLRKIMRENGFGILNMKLRYNMGCNNFLLDLSLGSVTNHIKTYNCIEERLLEFDKMTNLKGMDELFGQKNLKILLARLRGWRWLQK